MTQPRYEFTALGSPLRHSPLPLPETVVWLAKYDNGIVGYDRYIHPGEDGIISIRHTVDTNDMNMILHWVIFRCCDILYVYCDTRSPKDEFDADFVWSLSEVSSAFRDACLMSPAHGIVYFHDIEAETEFAVNFMITAIDAWCRSEDGAKELADREMSIGMRSFFG